MMQEFQNKKILALSSGEYAEFIKRVYEYCNLNLGCEIAALTNSKDKKYFKNIIDKDENYIIIPDLYVKSKWEESDIEMAELKSLMGKCEHVLGVPLNRIILMNERTIGRSYSKTKYYWEERSICKKVLKNPDTAQQVVMRCFKFALEVIERFQPDYIIGGLTGGYFNSMFYVVANYFHIPFLSCVESVLLPDRHTWVSNWGSYPELTEVIYREKLIKKDKPSESSLLKIKSFQEKPEVLPVYARSWSNKQYGLSLLSTHKAIFARLKYRLVPIIRNVRLSNPKPVLSFIKDAYRRYFNVRLQKKIYTSYGHVELKSKKYIYFPMHMEPEYVLNTRATEWYDQLNLLRMLSYNLPVGYKLLVKEHRNNFGRRPSSYLKNLASFPGIEVLNPFNDQFKYINNADLVITINGTTGFEALMLNKPLITLSKTFYDCVELDVKITSPKEIGSVLLHLLGNHKEFLDNTEKLGLLLDAEHEGTLPHDVKPEVALKFISEVVVKLKSAITSSEGIANTRMEEELNV